MIKKVFIACISVVILAVIALGAVASFDFNRMGKDNTYVQVVGQGEVEEYKGSNGAVYKTYWYTLPAYDEDGNEREVTFSAQKQLREGAYLMLYLNKEKEVTSYDEVQQKDLPKKVQSQIVK